MTRRILNAVCLSSILSLAAHAASISLTDDFSLTNGNPNGLWVYRNNSTNLSLESPVANGNSLRPAALAGYWGLGNDLNTNTPDLLLAGVNGSSAGGADLDFLAGDVVGHSPNDGTAGALYALDSAIGRRAGWCRNSLLETPNPRLT